MSASGVAVSPVPIQRSKLERPLVSGPFVPRPRLEAHLDRVLTTPLTILVAPAGHGKTRTLVEWLTTRNLDAAWLTLGSRDRDLTCFAAHLTAALDRVAPGVASVLYAYLGVPDRRSPFELGEVFGDALFDLHQDLVLVLDDYHAADTSAVAEFVTGLNLAAPARLHTILSSRRSPSLSLARLRTTGQVDELTAADFRFSEQDTAALLSTGVDAEVASALTARVHAAVGGWPAAVRLLAIGVGAGGTLGDSSTVPSANGEQLLLDYLSEEVLTHLTSLQRDLLLRASLPERFNAALLEALATCAGTAHGDPMELETLRGLDLYREIPGLDETWFAYHPLFRATFQRQLLSDLGAPAIADLHRVYGRWFAGDGLTHEAVWHFVQAGDITAASALIEAHIGAALDREDWTAIASWLRQIPESAIAQRPALLLASAWVAFLSGRGGALATRFGHLNTLRAQGTLSDAQIAEVDLLTLGGAIQSDADQRQAVTVAEGVIPRIPRSHRYRYGFAQLMLGLALGAEGRVQEALDRLASFTVEESARIDAASIRGFLGRVLVLWQAGLVAACEQTAADLFELAHRNGLPVSAGWGQLFLGMTAHERGDIDAAARHFAAVIAQAERLHFSCVREAFCRQVLIFERQGKAVEADRALARLRELVIAIEAPEHLAICDSLAARSALFRGDLGAATQWLALAHPELASVALLHIENPLVTRVMVLIALGTQESLREANRVVGELRRHAEVAHAGIALIDLEALTALLREAEGDRQGATAALRASLAYGAEEGIVARYGFLPLPLGPILLRLLMEPAPPPHTRAVLTSLETTVGTQQRLDDPTAQASLADTLTSREMDVLRCLARRLTNDEIGEELFISLSTVKHHIEHISGKLGVSGRRAVVTRAADLGLLTI